MLNRKVFDQFYSGAAVTPEGDSNTPLANAYWAGYNTKPYTGLVNGSAAHAAFRAGQMKGIAERDTL